MMKEEYLMISETIRLYEERDDVTLTTYVLGDSYELLAGKKRPAVLICPGGAYLGCSDREAEPVALRFAAMGYHAFVLRYSTYTEGRMEFPDLSKELTVKKHLMHPTPMREIGKSILMIRERMEEWLVDVDKIALCGFSAGAHNVAMYATYWQEPVIFDYFKVKKEMLRPTVVILGYGLSDYTWMKSYAKKPEDQALFAASNTAFLGDAEPEDSMLDEVSPAKHVTKDMPPAFLWATAADSLVPVQQTLLMAKAMADEEIPFELHVFEEGGHGLSLATQASATANSQIDQDAAKWVGLVEQWLLKRFAFDLPAKTIFEEIAD